MASPTLTIAVLTKNEAQRIVQCLESAAFADQVLVVDSGSTDNTRELAAATGAEVHNYPDWQGFAVQRNHLLAHASGDYIFFLDADEIITPELRQELQDIVRTGTQTVWRVRWRMVAFGHELTHFRADAGVERLFKRDMVRQYTGAVHEKAELTVEPTPRATLKGYLLHYSRETIRGSLEKLVQYAMLGAAKRAEKGKKGGVLRGLGSGSALFIRLYIFRLGFLCGGPGFLYCLFVGLEGFFRYAALEYDKNTLQSNVSR